MLGLNDKEMLGDILSDNDGEIEGDRLGLMEADGDTEGL